MAKKSKLPAWAPKEGGDAFAGKVIPGSVPSKGRKSGKKTPRRPRLTVDDYVKGVLAGNRAIMGRAISLIESDAAAHIAEAQEMLQALLPHTGKSIRVGITGVPGAGKSTLIEILGLSLLAAGHKVAVLAVDPTSSITGGSIMGDKTRMEKLAREDAAFIRPSPSGGALGGVARKTRETILICEAAGFDTILVETVGVGQSEIAVRSMVDFFLLLQIAGGGDELQGIKKGVIEIADAIFVNKADGDNISRAKVARQELSRALHYLTPATEGWQPKAYTCSAQTGKGIDKLWQVVEDFHTTTRDSGIFQQRRKEQSREWMHTLINEYLSSMFLKNPAVVANLKQVESAVVAGQLPVTAGARQLLAAFMKTREDEK